MGFEQAITSVFRNYFSIKGRASRSEYWYFIVFTIGLSVLLITIQTYTPINSQIIGIMSIVINLALFIPSITVAVRRLHDIDKSGWWYLICLVPFIGVIILIIFLVKRGNIGENRFGSDPLMHIEQQY